jgi:hypothetical protein
VFENNEDSQSINLPKTRVMNFGKDSSEHHFCGDCFLRHIHLAMSLVMTMAQMSFTVLFTAGVNIFSVKARFSRFVLRLPRNWTLGKDIEVKS